MQSTKKPKGKSTSAKQPEPRMIDSRNLAELLAATFAHPLLPHDMWEYISDGICELDNSFDKYENPEVMREILGLAPFDEKGGE